MWWAQFRNRYYEEVHFQFRITRPTESPEQYSDGIRIQAGETQEGSNHLNLPCAGGQRVDVWVQNFEFVSAGSEETWSCDGRTYSADAWKNKDPDAMQCWCREKAGGGVWIPEEEVCR